VLTPLRALVAREAFPYWLRDPIMAGSGAAEGSLAAL